MNRPGEHGPTHQEQYGRTDTGRTGQTGMGGTAGTHTGTTGTTGGTTGVMETLKEKAGDVAGQVREKAQDVASGARQAWDTTRHKAQEWGSDLADTAGDAWEGMGNFIRRYPVGSLLGAFAIGFLLGGGLAASSRRNW
jgi:hypothetical protein